MKWLIDGHNLIPKLGISLRSEEDEAALLEQLVEYARLTGRNLEVFFDRGANGFAHEKKIGTIKVHFVSVRTKADEALIDRVLKAKRPHEITVVSSDRHVQFQVKNLGARIVGAEKFAAEMRAVFMNPPKRKSKTISTPRSELESSLSDREIAYWIEIFNSERPEKYSE